MRTEFVYSIIALGAIPVTVNAAGVDVKANQISNTVMPSTSGKLEVGKVTLAPGSYTLKGSLESKVYDVKVTINGELLETIKANASATTELEIPIDLSKATADTEVEIVLESTDPTESGADFKLGAPYVNLTFDFASIKSTLVANANNLATTISGYSYAAKEEDVEAANALKTKADGIAESYDDYKKFKLYADKSTIQEEIDALAENAAKAEAKYQNEQAYNRVNAAITAIKASYNAAVAELEGALVDAAAYLLDDAKKDLNDNINLKITAATSASWASKEAETAVVDEEENTKMIPTEGELKDYVDKWKGQGTANQDAYENLQKVVTGLQTQLDKVTVADASLTETFAAERTTAQEAINSINTKVENAKNSAAQLTLDVKTDAAAAQEKISTLDGKVTKANAEFNANKNTTEAIAAVQKAYNDAKKTVDAKVSKDGDYKAADYYADYLKTQQAAIDKLTSDAADAYKVDGTGTAQTYNAGLADKTAPIIAAIDNYQYNAVAAVEKYDALQTAIKGVDAEHPGYQGQLDAARAQVEGLAVYSDDTYDYKTKFDLLQKRINNINKAIKAAQGKVGAEHWTAMLAIDADAAITTDIADLLTNVQADQNQYDADYLANGMTELEGKITAFKAKDASVLGADVAKFQAIETGIETANKAVKASKEAINPSSETVRYTERVETVNTAWWGNPDLSADWNPRNGYTGTGASPAVTTDDGRTQQMVENYNSGSCTVIGEILSQTISNLENGTYSVVLCANAFHANNVDNANGITEDANDVAYVFANGIKKYIVAKNASSTTVNGEYTIDNVKVTDGTLKIGLGKDKKGTNWHNIQIKSLKANTASLIQGWGAKVADLNAQQKALEAATEPVAAKVAANAKAKADLATSIDGLQTKTTTFKTTYKIGTDDTTLGNRGKADGSVTKEVAEIEKALGDLETTNNGFVPTVVTDVDKTSSVNKHKADDGWTTELKKTGNFRDWTVANIEAVEHWVSQDNNDETGVVFTQTVKNLANGLYDVVLYANAVDQKTAGKNGGAYVYANGVTKDVTVTENATDGEGKYTLNDVVVSDGTLKLGMVKTAAGTNWHSIQIKSLTYRENDQLGIYNNDDAEKPGYNNQYTKLAAQEAALEKAAPDIVNAVKNNADINTAATKAVADLQTAELNTLKSLKNVTNAEAVSDDATAKKADPANFKVFETGLAADKNYTAKKKAIDDDIKAMSDAIAASNANESLKEDWKDNSITVVITPDDEKTPDVDETVKKTYSIAAITQAINDLKAEAGSESDNWEAYKSLLDNNWSKLEPENIFTKSENSVTVPMTDEEITALCGAGAKEYYLGLQSTYTTNKATILTRMQADLTGRKSVSTKDAFVSEIAGLKVKIDAVKTDAAANLAKYTEQKKAYQDTQTLWNSTYTEIAATDHSSKVQEWLNKLDEIQVTLTAATEDVEASYPKGESVANAQNQDFAAIKAAINDVKAQQQEAYEAQIAIDNKIAHESFMGYEKDGEHVDGAIDLANKAYKRAVAERAQYSSTNEQIKKAVDEAAAELDAALFSAPTDIAALTEKENKAYAETQSPTVFNVSTYNADALTIEQKITNALDDFKTAVKTAINGVWSPKKGDKNTVDTYAYKLDQAETAIDGYSDDAKEGAFTDVEALIAQGDAGVASITLSDVEAAINALDNEKTGIDVMLAADKDAAAAKDITALTRTADDKYTEVKSYIDGVTIADDVNSTKANSLTNLQNAYDDGDETSTTDVAYAKTQDKTFANHDAIVGILNGFITKANGCKTDVETAVTNDVANTKAYDEMVIVIKSVADKLAEAEAAAAPYKYPTPFATVESDLANLKTAVENAKKNGSAVDYQTNTFSVALLNAKIENTLSGAFDTEKIGLASTDIPELKNQFNTYVANHELDEKATQFKKDIDALKKAVDEAEIKDLAITEEKPEGDGIDFEDIKAATNDLIKIQNDIANKESELLAANSSAANAQVLADFNNQIGELEKTASLEGYDEWVGDQKRTGSDKTLEEEITALKAQLAVVKEAIQKEKNLSFYKDNYQTQLNAIKDDLVPVSKAIAAKDAQFKENAEVYDDLTGRLNALKEKIDAAKVQVGTYDYVGKPGYEDYTYLIEVINEETGEVTGGAQKTLNDAKAQLELQNANKALKKTTAEAYAADVEADVNGKVQNYLDKSANYELTKQRENLSSLLTNAIDAKYVKDKYSSALWKRLLTEKGNINADIVKLAKDIYTSNSIYEGSFDVETKYGSLVYLVDGYYPFYFTLDKNDEQISRTVSCDADYADQMKTVNAIKGEIETLGRAVDNLDLLGDANVDGKVNVLDYQKVLNMILDPTEQPAEDTDLFANIDINQSTVIEVGDLTAIVNYILNQNWNDGNDGSYAAARSFNRGDNENLSLNYSSVNSDVQRIAVNLENANNYTAFQMDVVLPDGMKIVGTSLSSRAGQSHKLYSREQLDGSTRILVSSVSGEAFSGNEGAVLYIDVEGAKASSVEILNILFSDVNANTRAFKLGNNVTGIDAIGSTFDALKQKVYDLGGRVMNGVKKGINIIRNADGSTRKVAE